MLKYEYRLTVF